MVEMFRTKNTYSPVDRAAQELEQKIRSLERQIQELSSPRSTSAIQSPAERLTGYFKKHLMPPTTKMVVPTRSRSDLFDLTDEPLKELASPPVSFSVRAESDLFTAPTCPPVSRDRKLAEFLSVGSFRNHQPLKHEQRANKRRFYIWIALALTALCVVWIVVR